MKQINILLVGPPAAGKGTQAQKITEYLQSTYVSTGNMLREQIAAQTPLGLKAKTAIDNGQLVDDQIILRMVRKIIGTKESGFLFDGFPRTLFQAKVLDILLDIDMIIEIVVPDAILVKRITNRRMVSRDGHEYTFVSQYDADQFVQKHGGRIFTRDDDKPEIITRRLATYWEQTHPVLNFFSDKVIKIDGNQSIDSVWTAIKTAIDDFSSK